MDATITGTTAEFEAVLNVRLLGDAQSLAPGVKLTVLTVGSVFHGEASWVPGTCWVIQSIESANQLLRPVCHLAIPEPKTSPDETQFVFRCNAHGHTIIAAELPEPCVQPILLSCMGPKHHKLTGDNAITAYKEQCCPKCGYGVKVETECDGNFHWADAVIYEPEVTK